MRQPNGALATLISEAGYSEAALARRVNELGRMRQSLSLHYDYSAVYRWVQKGQRPSTPVPALIAEALTERLGRRIRPSDFGLADVVGLADRALTYHHDVASTVETVLDLGRAELSGRIWKRRSVVLAPFVVGGAAGPSRDWLLAAFDDTPGADDAGQVGMRQVDAIRQMFAVMQELDVMRGGGHARTALIEYLSGYVLPLVGRAKATGKVRAALHEAAAEQTYLVGWMAYDDGQHGLAQRYLIQALRLAQESGNHVLGAHVLAGLSDQANLLGHPEEALSLARAGQRGVRRGGSRACLADLQILEARALAALARDSAGRRVAARAVVHAENTFAGVAPADEPEWARFIDAAYFFGEGAQCFCDLGDSGQVETFGRRSSAAAARQRRARRGALSEAALALGSLAGGEVEKAAARALTAVSMAESVASSRARETIRNLTTRFSRHQTIPEVTTFQSRAHALLRQTV